MRLAPKRYLKVFVSEKNVLTMKTLTSIWVQAQKTTFFLILYHFSCFFPFIMFFMRKTCFNQRLECCALKMLVEKYHTCHLYF